MEGSDFSSYRFVLVGDEFRSVVPDVQQCDQPSSHGEDQNAEHLANPTKTRPERETRIRYAE